MPSHLSSLSDEELGKLVAELKEYEGLEIKTIVATAEIVFCDQHFCNDNLRQTQKVEATVPKQSERLKTATRKSLRTRVLMTTASPYSRMKLLRSSLM